MRYFTPELFLQVNSPDSTTAESAMEKWEKARSSYESNLKRVEAKMPPRSRPITRIALHDWRVVVTPTPDDAGSPAIIMLEDQGRIALLLYELTGKIKLIEAPEQWHLSKTPVCWLYDEVEVNGKSFWHRILLSNGTTLLVPFSKCKVVEGKFELRYFAISVSETRHQDAVHA